MLADKYVPTPLIDRPYHRTVDVAEQPNRLSWRTWNLAKELFLILLRIVGFKLRGKLTPEVLGRIVAESCERQGVLWVKVGQLMAMRNDVFHPGFCSELGKLHDRAHGFPGDEAVRQIEKELGHPLDHYFSEFNTAPMAAASIAQVHLARLKNKPTVNVAVKLQRGDAEETVKVDMVIFERLVRLAKWIKFKPRVRWDDLLWEVRHVMGEELDFRIEAANMRRMRKRLRRHKIYVPKLFPQFTTERLLVMEFVHGVPMSDYLRCQREDPKKLASWQEKNNVVPDKVGRRLLLSYLQQLFEDRLFHADMHPGNILLLRNSRMAIIDFGSIGSMERDLLRKYDAYMEALGQGNYSKAVDMLLMTTNSLPPNNLSGLKEELLRITRDWEARCRVEGLKYDETSASGLLDQTVQRGMQWGIDQNWTFLKVIRSWATMDISLRALLSDTNLQELLRRYHRERNQRRREQLLEARPIAASDVEWALEFGETAIENAFLRGTLLRRVGQVFEGGTNKVSEFFAIGFGLAFVALVGVALCLIMGLMVAPERLPDLDWQVWTVGFALLAYLVWTLWSLRSRFLDVEENTSYL